MGIAVEGVRPQEEDQIARKVNEQIEEKRGARQRDDELGSDRGCKRIDSPHEVKLRDRGWLGAQCRSMGFNRSFKCRPPHYYVISCLEIQPPLSYPIYSDHFFTSEEK